ncbi:MAG: lactate utilization protein C [Halobaculum sp.]
MTVAQPDLYDAFAEEAATYGVELTRVDVSTGAVRETLAEVIEQPAVGAPLPWEEVSLPASVTTEPTPAELTEATTGVTAASFAVAEYGSVILAATPDGSEPASLFPDLHVFVLDAADIVPDMRATFERLGDQFRADRSSAILATGPSATADMGALVQGAHGPERVHGVVIDR